jgi:DNA-binding CsgD family transcriptional regulator
MSRRELRTITGDFRHLSDTARDIAIMAGWRAGKNTREIAIAMGLKEWEVSFRLPRLIANRKAIQHRSAS